MKSAALLIVVLSHAGFWFGGTSGTASFVCPVEGKLPDSTLDWELVWNGIRLADGIGIAVKGAAGKVQVRVPTPRVRVAITARLIYQLRETAVGGNPPKQLESGEVPLRLYPRDTIEDFSRRTVDHPVAVVDSPDGLPKILAAAHFRFRQVDNAKKLQWGRSDIVMVGPDRIDDSPFAQSALLSLARSGSSVMVFAQTRCRNLGGLRLIARPAPRNIEWCMGHSLLSGLSTEELRGILSANRADVFAIQAPEGLNSAVIACWPHDRTVASSTPADALVVSQPIGSGRIAFCQLPLEGWDENPLSQRWLNNVLNWLFATTPVLSRPATTPLDVHPTHASTPRLPEITIPAGDER